MAAGVFLLTLTLLDFLVLGDEAFAKSNTFCPGGEAKNRMKRRCISLREKRIVGHSMAKVLPHSCRVKLLDIERSWLALVF